MTRHVSVIESTPTQVVLSLEEARALDDLGKKLASIGKWHAEDDETPVRSIIDCRRSATGEWTVQVREAVGVVSIGTLQISVVPKIPQPHFFYLASLSELVPRVEEQQTFVARSDNLWELMAQWFVKATERLIRRDLTRGYTEIADELDVVRGQILPIETATQCLLGRPVAECRFEEFSEDIPLNRVIKEAAEKVASSPVLDPEVRKRAKGILSRLGDVGRMNVGDMRVRTDRLTYRYKEPLAFAKTIIRSTGPLIKEGEVLAWSFLLRTPDVVEAGVRHILRDALRGITTVDKRSLSLDGANMTLNPDLVFGSSQAVGDVKYKQTDGEWIRTDLYQSVAFATAFESERSCVIGFSTSSPTIKPPVVQVGAVEVSYFAFRAEPGIAPAVAGAELGKEVRQWVLAGLGKRSTRNAGVA